MPRRKDRTDEQAVIEQFSQPKIAMIEKWAGKYDAIREEINEKGEALDNAEFKLRELMHQFEADVDKRPTDDGGIELVYKRADFNVVVKRGKEKVNVKIKEASKGDEPESTRQESLVP